MTGTLKSNNPKVHYQVHTDADYDNLKREAAKLRTQLDVVEAKLLRLTIDKRKLALRCATPEAHERNYNAKWLGRTTVK